MTKVSAKAKAKAAEDFEKEAHKRKIAAATTLIEKQDIADAAPKRPRSRVVLVDEKIVSKMIRDNFKTWGPELTDLTLRDGLSLRGRMTRDKTLAVKGLRKEPMGKLYYQELRSLYGSALSPEHQLVVADEDEPEDGRLVQALEGLFSRKKQYDGMQSYLLGAAVLSQKNLVALFKGCLMLNPNSSVDHNNLAIALMEYCQRNGIKAKYPQETGVMKNYFDGALCKAFYEFRKHELSRQDFWAKFGGLLHFVMPVDAAKYCFECTGAWSTVETHLAAVVESGELGRVLFGKSWASLSASKVSHILSKHVDELFHTECVTEQHLQNSLADLQQKVKNVGKDISDIFVEPREVAVRYLGVELSIPVSSDLEQYNLLVWARIKEWAICKGELPSLWGESFLKKDETLRTHADEWSVDLGVVQQVANSRKIAASYLKYKDLAGTEVDAVLKEHGSFLMQMDKRFKLEAQFFRSMLDGDAVERLQDQVMACLPTGPGISASAVAGRLATVTQSDLFKWVGPGGQSQALSVAATVRSLAAVKPPSFSVTNDPSWLFAGRSAGSSCRTATAPPPAAMTEP